MINPEELANRFAFHPADTDEKKEMHEQVRRVFGQLATELNENLPDGREKALVMTSLEEAMFWSNASIARNL